MEDDTHLLQYKRFFAVLLSVLPGMLVSYGLTAFVLWLFDDVLNMFGVAAGLGGFVFFGTVVAWIFIGLMIQRWAEEKPMGFLAGLCSPFIIIIVVFMGWLFSATVLITTCSDDHGCGHGQTCQEGRCRDALPSQAH
jgi:hypothetical protein